VAPISEGAMARHPDQHGFCHGRRSDRGTGAMAFRFERGFGDCGLRSSRSESRGWLLAQEFSVSAVSSAVLLGTALTNVSRRAKACRIQSSPGNSACQDLPQLRASNLARCVTRLPTAGGAKKRTVSGSAEYVSTNDWVCKGWSITLEFRSRQTIRYRRCKDLWELLVS
jgi:hypothetical protein